MDVETNAPTKKGNKTQQCIYKAAIELIKEQGYEQTTIVDICRAANVSNGAFYHHFKSKQDILFSFVDNESRELRKYYDSLCSQSPAEVLTKVLDWQIEYYLIKGYEFIAHLYAALILNQDKNNLSRYSLVPVLCECLKNGQDQGVFKNDLDVQIMATTLFFIIYSATSSWCVLKGDLDLKANLFKYLEPQIRLYTT